MHQGRDSTPAKAGSVALSFLVLLGAASARGAAPEPELPAARVAVAAHHDTSPPLWLMPVAEPSDEPEWEHRQVRIPRHAPPAGNVARLDPVHQATRPWVMAMPTATVSFDGVGGGFSGPAGTFSVDSMPPDTQGDVGPSHYVQVVNAGFAVFNKSGTAVYGPVPTQTLWTGFGGVCENTDQGDGIVLYDQLADRWFITQFAFDLDGQGNATAPFFQCIAVSVTGDPTGQYNRYGFQYTDFPDYGKFGVWPDGYYATYNAYAGGTTYSGSLVCAYDRARMLAGKAATHQCINLGRGFGGLLPTDFDGTRLPPNGAPNYILGFEVNPSVLQLWRFHVDWASPANTTLTRQPDLPVATINLACISASCVPQSGTSTVLDALGDRLMYRVAYRNFGTYEALVLNHTAATSTATNAPLGVRWYEVRNPGGTPTVFQQGTYAPDTSYRWLGSLAQDQLGNMALGFSVSSSATHPAIAYTGRLVGDTAGTMPQGETTLLTGAGSQIVFERWGDYSMMSVDPVDDCTFWFTSEYVPSNGYSNWRTRVASFKFPGCPGVTNDFSVSASPRSQTLMPGGSVTYTITTAVKAGTAQTLTFSTTNLPTGVSSSFSPATVTAGGTSTLTLTAGAAAAAVNTATFNVVATAGSTSRLAFAVVNIFNDFSISASPATAVVTPEQPATFTVTTAKTAGNSELITFSASNLPTNVTATFNPTQVLAGGSTTLTLTGDPALTPQAARSVTIAGTSVSATHSATVTVTALAAPTVGFSSPASGKVRGTVTVTAQGAVSSGTTLDRVELTVDDAPLSSGTTLPFTAQWDTTKVANGDHTLRARVYDTAGSNTVADLPVTVFNVPPPTVTVKAPREGETIKGMYNLQADAAASNGAQLTRTEFDVDNVSVGSVTAPPLQVPLDTTRMKDGAHVLAVKAYDSEGQVTTSTTVNFKVNNSFCGCTSGGGAAGTGGLLALLLALRHLGGSRRRRA